MGLQQVKYVSDGVDLGLSCTASQMVLFVVSGLVKSLVLD